MDPHDNTAIIDMKKNFQKFLSSDDSRKRSRLDFSDNSLLESSQQVSAGQSYSRDGDGLKTKTDLIYCKSRITMLEQQLGHKERETKELVILHEREISDLKHVHDRELRGYSVLKTSHERVLHRQELCERELEERKEHLEQTKTVYDEKIRQLQKRNLDQDMLHTEQLEEQKSKCRELRNRLVSVQADLSVTSSELTQVKEQFSELKQKLNDSQSSNADPEEWKCRAQQAEERQQQLEGEIERYKDDMLLMETRKKDLARLIDISEENKKLNHQVAFYKMTGDNVEVMKEQVRTLERQLKSHEQLQEKVARLEVENENYQYRVDELEAQRIPEDAVVRLREAQHKEAVMLENIGQLKSKNRLLESRVEELEGYGVSLQSKLSGAGEDSARLTNQKDRLQRQIQLLSRERDGYKKILDSYECEMTRELVSKDKDKAVQLQQILNQYTKANEQLEKGLLSKEKETCSLKQTIEQLKAKIAESLSQSFKDSSAASVVDSCQLLELRKKIEELEKDCEKVTEERDILEARIEQRDMQGDYDPTKTKVLHFTKNPFTQAQKCRADELRLLREENMRLRERIKVLEKNLAEVHDITAQVEANLNAPSSQENQQLKEVKAKLANCEKRYEKLLEMCKTTSLEFRQVVYQLTGFRIDVPKSKQYKLMHMYANSPEDYLLFQETEEGELQLLETQYASTLVELAEEHLLNQHSIPVFLSSLTIDLFKQSTMLTSMM